MNPLYNVYVSDRGPASATEIAAIIAETLADLGYCTAFPALGLPERGRNRINLVVAPNDFFRFQGGHSQRDLLDAARVSITLGVDGPGTPGFDVGTHYASVGPMALDISEDGVDALRSSGYRCRPPAVGIPPALGPVGRRPEATAAHRPPLFRHR